MYKTDIIKLVGNDTYKQFGKEWKRVIKTSCQICGKDVFRKPWDLNKTQSLCSYKCVGLYRQSLIKDKDTIIFNLRDTHNFNYLLGLLATDGYIYDKHNKWHCSIGLNNSDRYILEHIQKLFNGRIIKHSKTSSKWMLHNKPFVKWLIDIGITNKKSFTLNIDKYFNTLTHDNQCALMRGIIDGDGCITQYGFSIVSASEAFIKMCRDFFDIGTISKTKTGYYTFSIYKNAHKCLEKIYNVDDGDLLLERKYIKYKIIEDRINKRKKINGRQYI